MIKTKFVFAVSLVAMLAVSSAWANAPGNDEDVGDVHTVYTDQSPTDTKVEGGTAIAGVTYVNRAVNKAGAAATAAEAHAAAAGQSALDAAESATQAASSAKKANDALAGKQDKLGYTAENSANKVTTLTSTSSDKQYPSAKVVYTELNKKENTSNKIDTMPEKLQNITDGQYPSAKAVFQYVSGQMTTVNSNNNALSGRVESLENAVTAEGALQDVVGNAESGLVKDVADLKTDKEATANKLKSSDKTTVVSDTNKDTLFPTVGRVQSMINALDVTDSAVGDQYVSAVSETDGKIKVTRAALPTIGTSSLTIKNGATNTNIATFGANATADVTATIPAASATVAGLAKIGVIPSGSVESASYATIWVE